MKRQVMSRAWEIAKAAAVKFGGNSKQYIAGAMRMAWAEAKAPVAKKQYSSAELCKLSKMRAGARENAFAADPELRAAYAEYTANRKEAAPEQDPFAVFADSTGRFTFNCSECGNTFKSFGKYAKCPCCGEDTHSMVRAIA